MFNSNIKSLWLMWLRRATKRNCMLTASVEMQAYIGLTERCASFLENVSPAVWADTIFPNFLSFFQSWMLRTEASCHFSSLVRMYFHNQLTFFTKTTRDHPKFYELKQSFRKSIVFFHHFYMRGECEILF